MNCFLCVYQEDFMIFLQFLLIQIFKDTEKMKEYVAPAISAHCFPLLDWSNYAQPQQVLVASGA